ncbi:endonuclease [Aliiglaciecola litoralis]|uniref:Endonuclease I n=1 Tax=Aliiglaciecola litoralis TaxID=582857 RepID=A0ABN1LFR5_9ALTE
MKNLTLKVGAKGLFVLASALMLNQTLAAVPAGYYDTANTSTPQTLRNTLHQIIDDHQRFPYTSSATDTWDILEAADQDPDNPNNVIDIYKNASYAKVGGGNTNYNREHSWPKSYGFPSDGSDNSAYTDAHHLFIANSGYNSSRSNKPYANCGGGCSEKPTDFNNNRGGQPNDSNWTEGSFSAGSWETWMGRRGDVARALMYMAVRYEGGTHGVTGFAEPDLILTDDRAQIDASNQGANISVAYMGLKSVLLQWHKEDPVDAFETHRNDVVYSHQGNRNPFIDHPEYAECIFESICNGGTPGDTTAPVTPAGISATGGNGFVELAWSANTESDLAGYNVYRATTSGGTFSQINGALVNTSAYTDSAVAADTTYFYKITAVDTSSNESTQSAEVFATTEAGTPPSTGSAWINEFHYDNDGSDTGEFVEIAGSAGTDLTGWQILAYNGSGGVVYKTTNLSGTIANQQSGFGTLSFSISGLQNGAPDGFALVDNTGSVVQFLSYEGSFAATDGAAMGMTSTNVGVSETSTTPVGFSLQLAGTGASYSEFVWQSAANNTAGQANTNQTFSGSGPVNQAPIAVFSESCTLLSCTFDAAASSDDGTIVSYDWTFGDSSSGTGINPSHSYATDGSFTVTLTVTDDQGAADSVSTIVSVVRPLIDPWINEFHYDNKGNDRNEFVEIAGPAGTDISGWTLVAYNGSDGTQYKTVTLNGVLPNQQNGYGVLAFDMVGLQNGSPDGIALIDDTGTVIQLISYEGTFTATDGAANGMTSTDVGVSETSSTKSGRSIQLIGSGSEAADFNWQAPKSNSKGSINSGQSF